jgi:flagellar biosynthetic protein FliP
MMPAWQRLPHRQALIVLTGEATVDNQNRSAFPCGLLGCHWLRRCPSLPHRLRQYLPHYVLQVIGKLVNPVAAIIIALSIGTSLMAQTQAAGPPSLLPEGIGGPQEWTSPQGLASTLQIMLLLTVVSLAPAILLMTTSFVRIIVVLGLLRQALGTQQLPPSQVITSIALFMTLLLMAPVWKETYNAGIKPYTNNQLSLEEAFTHGVEPVRRFMSQQIQRTENDDDVYLFLRYMPSQVDPATGAAPNYVYYDAGEGEVEVPIMALLPAFMLSELKTAFLIGFQIYLPFVILDIVVASVTISMGMLMLPPVLVSLPFKLLLFVLVDGWHLVVEMLLESFHVSGFG